MTDEEFTRNMLVGQAFYNRKFHYITDVIVQQESHLWDIMVFACESRGCTGSTRSVEEVSMHMWCKKCLKIVQEQRSRNGLPSLPVQL